MRNKGLLAFLLVATVLAGTASAEEVIHFTNGTALPVRSHEVEGDMIKVDLGDNGFMAFPKSVVEKIEAAPGVILQPSTASNRMFESKTSTRVYAQQLGQAMRDNWSLPADPNARPGEERTAGGVVTVPGVIGNNSAAAQKIRQVKTQSLSNMGRGKQRDRQATASGGKTTVPNPSINLKTRYPLRRR